MENIFHVKHEEQVQFGVGGADTREAGAAVVFTRVLSIYHLHAVCQTTAIQKTISLREGREILTTAICQHDRAFISEPEPEWEPLSIKTSFVFQACSMMLSRM